MRYYGEDGRGMTYGITVNLHGDWFRCINFDVITGLVVNPLLASLVMQQEVQEYQYPPQFATLVYNTDIQQPIIATGLPSKFDGSPVQLGIADHNLYRSRLDFTASELQCCRKILIAKIHPETCKQITYHAQTFHWLFFNGMRYLGIKANAHHQQKIAIVHLSHVDDSCLTMPQQHSREFPSLAPTRLPSQWVTRPVLFRYLPVPE